MGRLDGKVAIVTGGASGLGLAMVERFVREGAKVVFTDLPPDPTRRNREPGGPHDGSVIAERLGASTRFVPADVSVGAELDAVFSAAVEGFGGLDVVCNNAGIGAIEGSVAECPEDVFDRVVDVDLKAVWRGTQLAARHLAGRGGGSIINTGSVAGLSGAPGMGSYSAAKGGVIALTRAAAVELAPQNVRVNCICPGAIVTPIICDSAAFDAPLDPDLVRLGLGGAQPLPRAGEAVDVANLALFLASDESSFVTGQIIAVDGGLTAETDARNRAQAVGDTLGLG